MKNEHILGNLILSSFKKVMMKNSRNSVLFELWDVSTFGVVLDSIFQYNSRRTQFREFFIITFLKEHEVSFRMIGLLFNFVSFFYSLNFFFLSPHK